MQYQSFTSVVHAQFVIKLHQSPEKYDISFLELLLLWISATVLLFSGY